MLPGETRNKSIHLSGTQKLIITLVSGLLFLAVTMLAVMSEMYIIWLIPPALLLLLLAISSLDSFFLILVFFVPLSVQLRFIVHEPPADLFLPTELMIFIIMFIMLYKMVSVGEYEPSFLKNRVSLLIIIMIAWMAVSSLASTLFLVSVKFLIVRIWFILAFYFLALELFRRPGFLKRTLTAYILGMAPVVIYNIIRLSASGLFNQLAAHSSVRPFFNDHTSFGAALAFLIPVSIWFVYATKPRLKKLLYLLVLLLFTAGIIFSYSRAAWISLFIAGGFGLLMLAGIPWRLSIPSFLLVLLAVLLMWPSIIQKMNTIDQTSSGNMSEHLQSVANITSDDSNLERINRWKSALRMTAERPLTGWGPGTYQFQYAPYQYSYDKTSISTNFGTGGNAHSEFLGSLVETGVPGLIIFIMLVVFALGTGLHAWDTIRDREQRYLALALLCGLLSYIIHGTLNNFLDTDKIASLFWMYIAALIVLGKQRDMQRQRTGAF
ncbi:MAG: O-antigen ligase family protein [Bacteroidales bacterium]|nr:O-antigen ligase family protein [Bacteroidales bacterium]